MIVKPPMIDGITIVRRNRLPIVADLPEPCPPALKPGSKTCLLVLFITGQGSEARGCEDFGVAVWGLGLPSESGSSFVALVRGVQAPASGAEKILTTAILGVSWCSFFAIEGRRNCVVHT